MNYANVQPAGWFDQNQRGDTTGVASFGSSTKTNVTAQGHKTQQSDDSMISAIRMTVVCAVCLHFPISDLDAQEVRQFRGANSGVYSGTNLPVKWSDKENVVWRVPLPGYGTSSPIATGNSIFVTSYSGYGVDGQTEDKSRLRLHVTCFDRKTGKRRWDRSMKANPNERTYRGYIKFHGYASSTPVTVGTAVFAFFGSSGVVAYDLAGKLLWKQSVGSKVSGLGSGSSLLLFKDTLVVNAIIESDFVLGLNVSDGMVKWRHGPHNPRALGSPLLLHRDNARPTCC